MTLVTKTPHATPLSYTAVLGGTPACRLYVPRNNIGQSIAHNLCRLAQKSLAPVTSSCTTIPVIAIIANRPLFSSLVCMANSSVLLWG